MGVDDAASRAYVRAATGREMPPTQPYVGLFLAQARLRASDEGRELRVLSEREGRRSNLRPNRVNVVIDAEGRVTAADAG